MKTERPNKAEGACLNTGDLRALYQRLKKDIDARLAEFAALWKNGTDAELWREFCFCTCTPQNDAKKADAAVARLDRDGLLAGGSPEKIALGLRAGGVRFHNNKAAYIVRNRAMFFPDTKRHIQAAISGGEIGGETIEARNALAKTVNGWGLKEASHFLRNIGFGGGLCILDRHILRSLCSYGVLAEIPASLTLSRYTEIENSMLAFAKKTQIPPDALDLTFWFQAKGEIFK
ncbi:MAG: N-glycosylase/DNA lyase [Spirochaetaceae bacterium]|jgi:N-glycosylase/DNA lyase|nr:N-glycosylase/DNA lyase [Spirochaetaceae bacterium]